MKISCISDVHNQISKVNVPDCDILIIAGDLTSSGSVAQIDQFNADLEPIVKRGIKPVVIFGNHDGLGEENFGKARAHLSNVSYLLNDSSCEIDGIKFYGSAFTPEFGGWWFSYKRGEEAVERWSRIPNDTDILITHGQPYGINDEVNAYSGKLGCPDLFDAIMKRSSIKAFVGGHLHGGAGVKEFMDKIFINAASCNEKYEPVNKPIVFDFDPLTKKVELI